MKNETESRSFERFNHEAPIIQARHNCDDFHAARMYNYSMDGMCFVSDTALDPGADINIRMEYHSPMIYGPISRDNYRATVRWCKSVSDVYASYYGKYEIGVKYEL